MTRPVILPDSVIPKYHQLKEWLREQIAASRPGDPIPSEPQLCKDFNISRTTARKAVADLVHEGLLYRQQGHGTFVAQPKLEERYTQLAVGFHQYMTSHGIPVVTEVLEQCVVPASRAVADRLGIQAGEPMVKLVRVRSVDGKRLLIATTFIPHNLCIGLEHDDLSQVSLYALLAEKYGLRIARGVRTVKAARYDDRELSLLGADREVPALVVSAVMSDDQGRKVEFSEAKHRGDLCQLEIQVLPAAPEQSVPRGEGSHPRS
jgi:GntR family transcriptional regulator